jgi:hypothetical protein
MAREMYDYEKDPNETISIIDKPEYQKDQKEMEKLFMESLDREYKSCTEYSKIADFKTPIRTDIKTGKSNRNEVE